MKSKLNSSGQALLLVLLIMAVALVLVLSIVSRSITDVSVSSTEEESLRALSAAEAGIERAILTGQDFSQTVGDTVVSATVKQLGEGESEYAYPEDLRSGESATVWFISRDDNNNLTCNGKQCFTGTQLEVCWGTPGTPSNDSKTPAIEAIVFYDPDADLKFGNVQVGRATADPNNARITGPNGNNFTFTNDSCSFGNGAYEFSETITLGSPITTCTGQAQCLLFARVRMLYNDEQSHPIAFRGKGGTFATQGVSVTSIGQIQSSGVSRAWQATRLRPEPPSIFDSALFSLGDVIKGN